MSRPNGDHSVPIPSAWSARERAGLGLTLYWHDYETWGVDPRRDRPAQFAGLRTDPDLRPLGDPLMIYCRPPEDGLPHPEACLVTGISPQRARRDGLLEADFMALIHAELSRAGTCGLGYNSLRFDDEVTRHGLYRNFLDPYAREWRDGNSRWDLIDLVRLTRALRPEGIQWPDHPDGTPSYRLEDLCAANGVEHVGAHDALADVRATIELARLVRRCQPRLYDYLFALRDKRRVAPLLDPSAMKPMLHVSAMFPARYGCLAIVAPLALHPGNRNGVIVVDLRYDPSPLIELEPQALRERLFTPVAALPDGKGRVALKTVHLNRCPALAPLNTLTEEAARRWDIDLAGSLAHLERIKAVPGLAAKLAQSLVPPESSPPEDPEQALYAGFIIDADRLRIARVRATAPAELGGVDFGFADPRLPELLFRYRARNFPATLSEVERRRWREFVQRRLTDPGAGGALTLTAFREELEVARARPDLDVGQRALLDLLEDYAAEIAAEAGISGARDAGGMR